MADFVLNINDIDELGKDYELPICGAWVSQHLAAAELAADPAVGDGTLSLHAQKNGQEILLQGHLDVNLLTRCVRCLGDAQVAVHADLIGLLRLQAHDRRARPDDEGDDADGLDPGLVVGDCLHLDEWVRENIVVEAPMRPICGDDCNGLEVPAHIRPPEDFGGADKGVDPRLLPLMKLKDKVRPNKE